VITFNVTFTMKRRWARQLIGMFTHMQRLGNWGSSRYVTLYVDGDGDFRPRFTFSEIGAEPSKPIETKPNGDTIFDAG
jgi:hypothetical protein